MFSLGLLFFFFIARFLIFAFIIAAVFGLFFYAGRKALGLSHHRRQTPVWKGDLLMDYPIDLTESRRAERIIEVR